MKYDTSYPPWVGRHYKAEAFDLWHYYSWRRYESCIRMRIDFDEHLDEMVLAEAFEQSCVTFPLIACAFDTTPLIRPRWVPRQEAAREILRVVEARDNQEEEIQRAFTEVPSVKEGPQLRAILVRSAGQSGRQDSLCLIINHMLCDAAGFKQYLRGVARLYTRVAEGLTPSPAPFVAQRSTWPVARGLTWKEYLRIPFTPFGPNMKAVRKFHQPVVLAFESGPLSLLMESLPAESFKLLRAAAKARGFTVNTLLMAAIALACHRLRGVDKFLLPCTMDMRGFAPPDTHRGIMNLSCDCPCIIQIAPDDTMEDAMAKYAKEMKVYRQRFRGVNQLIRWELFVRLAHFRLIGWISQIILNPYPLGTTNMGIVDEDCVRFGGVLVRSVHMVAGAVPFPAFTIAMSTFRDELTLSVYTEGDEARKAFIRTLLTTMKEEMIAFGSRYPAGGGRQPSDTVNNNKWEVTHGV
jgi:NRPS condensation-like uncharacterized protein